MDEMLLFFDGKGRYKMAMINTNFFRTTCQTPPSSYYIGVFLRHNVGVLCLLCVVNFVIPHKYF